MSDQYAEKRRKFLKTLTSGTAGATAYHAIPVAWKKPITQSIVLPAHAQTTPPARNNEPEVPSFIDTVEFAYVFEYPDGECDTADGDEPPQISGTLTPGNSPEEFLIDMGDSGCELPDYDTFTLTPTVIVDPSITDTFDLTVNEVIGGGNETNFTPANQELSPDNTNGAIPFNTISGNIDDARFVTYQVTLTPSDGSLETFFLEITFDEAPSGSGSPVST